MRTTGSPIEGQIWQRLESEHQQLHDALTDVRGLVAASSYTTARKRFGTFRMSLERHLAADSRLLVLCEDDRKLERFLRRVRRNRAQILEQAERVWAQLCHEKGGALPRMLGRLSRLVVANEADQRRLILADLPLSPERRRLHRVLLLELGAI